MKNKKNDYKRLTKILSILVLIFVFAACNVLDDVEDLSNYPGEGTFDDLQTTNAYLAALYDNTFSGWPVNQGTWSDECGTIMEPEWITINNSTMKYWPYDIVRNINILISELLGGDLNEEEKKTIIGQAKFLRAYHYFKMVYYHGGVPIIKNAQELTDDLMVSRNSTKECFDFIIEDLDDAIAALPDKYSGDNYGRIDKAAAFAFKGRVLLYKASPQFNSSNPYDNQYWADAYTANKTAKDFLDSHGYGLLENYVDIFETEGHKENILSEVYQEPVKKNGRYEHGVRPLSESKLSYGRDLPAWSLAEAYPMLDGKKPGDPNSKYVYDVQTFWKNRDPRFEANIVWNGAIYELSGKTGRRQYTMSGIAESTDAFGTIVLGTSYYQTGLFCRKGINESLDRNLADENDYDWPEIRYTEVLFNYAEAANETGRSNEALEVLKAIRERAGIEAGEDGMYGLEASLTTEETRMAILDEKFIEMAFEGHRFWDLRRHRMLDELDGMRKYGIMAVTVNGHAYNEVTPEDAEKAESYELLPEDFEYEINELITTSSNKIMSMPETYYFFPIQLVNIDQNPNLEQNIGWGGTFNPEL